MSDPDPSKRHDTESASIASDFSFQIPQGEGPLSEDSDVIFVGENLAPGRDASTEIATDLPSLSYLYADDYLSDDEIQPNPSPAQPPTLNEGGDTLLTARLGFDSAHDFTYSPASGSEVDNDELEESSSGNEAIPFDPDAEYAALIEEGNTSLPGEVPSNQENHVDPPVHSAPQIHHRKPTNNGITKKFAEDLAKLSSKCANATEMKETPKELDVELLTHQKQALAWMLRCEDPVAKPIGQPLGGILADDQGFGKTLSFISLLLAAGGNTLVVAPTSILRQWAEELETRVKEQHRLRVFIYHGISKQSMNRAKLKDYDVVITSYGVLVQEYPKVIKMCHPITNKPFERIRPPGLLFRASWKRIILDEAQAIKNRTSNSHKAACAVKAKHRWAATGTPIQNTVDDLYALLLFLKYHVVETHAEWKRRFKDPLEGGKFSTRVRERTFAQFQAILGPVLLRRAKNDMIDGKPILKLPERNVHTVELDFSERERRYYNNQEFLAVRRMNAIANELAMGSGISNALVILLRLRQACNHPRLCEWGSKNVFNFSDDELDDVERRMRTRGMFLALPTHVQSRLLVELGPDTNASVQTCPVCMDVITEGIVTVCGHVFCHHDFQAWIAGRPNRTCPTCRGPLAGESDSMLLSEVRKEVHAVVRRQKREGTEVKLEQLPSSEQNEIDESDDEVQHVKEEPTIGSRTRRLSRSKDTEEMVTNEDEIVESHDDIHLAENQPVPRSTRWRENESKREDFNVEETHPMQDSMDDEAVVEAIIQEALNDWGIDLNEIQPVKKEPAVCLRRSSRHKPKEEAIFVEDEIQPVQNSLDDGLGEIEPVNEQQPTAHLLRRSSRFQSKKEDFIVENEIQAEQSGCDDDGLNEIQPVRKGSAVGLLRLSGDKTKEESLICEDEIRPVRENEPIEESRHAVQQKAVQKIGNLDDETRPATRQQRRSMRGQAIEDGSVPVESIETAGTGARQQAIETEPTTADLGDNEITPVEAAQSTRRRRLEIQEAGMVANKRRRIEQVSSSAAASSSNDNGTAQNHSGIDNDANGNNNRNETHDNDRPLTDVGTSVKISAFLTEFSNIISETRDKVLCFSQWTRMLELLQEHLDPSVYVRLDGSQSLDTRSRMVSKFKTDPKCRLFLISLKAGSTGLNLTMANRVFLLDSWWNPAVEDQAIDRVHRLGQTKAVEIIKFKIKNSVEDKIFELQNKKRAIADGALGKEGLKVIGRQQLCMNDILGLFENVYDNVAQRTQDGGNDDVVGMIQSLRNIDPSSRFHSAA